MSEMLAGFPITMFKPGTRVEVRKRFDQTWTRGFEVAEALTASYRIRRLSDGSVLPSEFDAEELRQERKKQSLWWY
jgi:hypothetical protein